MNIIDTSIMSGYKSLEKAPHDSISNNGVEPLSGIRSERKSFIQHQMGKLNIFRERISLTDTIRKHHREESGEGEIGGIAVVVGFILFALLIFWGCEWLESWDPGVSAPSGAPKMADLNQQLSDTLMDLQTDLPQALKHSPKSSSPDYDDANWVVINQESWELAPEMRFLKPEAIPSGTRDISYVLVVSPVRKASAGHWKYQGSYGGSWEEFRSEYTLSVVDWSERALVTSEACQGQKMGKDGGDSLIPQPESWKENQKKGRPTILNWLLDKGATVAPEYGDEWG